MASHNGHSGHHRPEILTKGSKEVGDELWDRSMGSGGRFWLIAVVLAGLLVLGVVGFLMKAGSSGFDDHRPWGYLAAVFAFLLTTSLSAPLVSVALRMARTHFSRPLSRVAELWSVVGILSIVLMIPLLIVQPSGLGRSTFWFVHEVQSGPFSTWPPGAPHVWSGLAVGFLALTALAILWVGAIPDMAAGRDRVSGLRGALYRTLSLGWRGHKRQWRVLRGALGLLGALYFMFLIYGHTVVSYDFAQSLVPGYKDSIFPTYHALQGLQAAMATVMVTLFVVRKAGRLEDYIGVTQFWSLSKIMLASTLLWGYFWWSGFFIFWYGRTPLEQNVLHLFMTGPYKPLFFVIFTLSFLIPAFGILIWNPMRRSILGPTLAATSILAGTFLERIRIYVAAHSVGLPDQEGHLSLHDSPAEFARTVAVVMPEVADVLMVVGALAGAVLLYLIATRILPMVSIWENRETLRLQAIKPLEKLELKIVAKPE